MHDMLHAIARPAYDDAGSPIGETFKALYKAHAADVPQIPAPTPPHFAADGADLRIRQKFVK